MTATNWNSLPNAESIKRLRRHAALHPHKWVHMEYTEARAAAWYMAKGLLHPDHILMARAESKKLYSAELSGPEASALLHATEGAFLALAAWDDCAYMLDLHPDVVRTLSASGNPAAILLLPAVIAINQGADDEIDSPTTEREGPQAV